MISSVQAPPSAEYRGRLIGGFAAVEVVGAIHPSLPKKRAISDANSCQQAVPRAGRDSASSTRAYAGQWMTTRACAHRVLHAPRICALHPPRICLNAASRAPRACPRLHTRDQASQRFQVTRKFGKIMVRSICELFRAAVNSPGAISILSDHMCAAAGPGVLMGAGCGASG
jgi:hypothetical protein